MQRRWCRRSPRSLMRRCSMAVQEGDLAEVEALLAHGCGRRGKELRTSAEEEGQARVDTLLAKGADVKAVDKDGTTPLQEAAEWPHRDESRRVLATARM